MKLSILLPTHVFLEVEVTKIVAEGEDGAFGLLERHIDFVSYLTPGILTYQDTSGTEMHVAVDRGTLVKKGSNVTLSVRRAVQDPNLETLTETVQTEFERISDREKKMRGAAAQIEAGFVRKFLDIQGNV